MNLLILYKPFLKAELIFVLIVIFVIFIKSQKEKALCNFASGDGVEWQIFATGDGVDCNLLT